MSNYLKVPHTNNQTHIEWRKDTTTDKQGLNFTVYGPGRKPIAKAKLTAEQIHAYVCMHNTMK
jgi:hypothetical protein